MKRDRQQNRNARNILVIACVVVAAAGLIIYRATRTPKPAVESPGPAVDSPARSSEAAQTSPAVPPYYKSAEAAQPYPVLLPAGYFQGNPLAERAYRIAAAMPGVLAQQPCYCHCNKFGHHSLLDCYASNHAAG